MSSISSRSLSMSSLIFLRFLASSGLPAAPSPPSAGLVGFVSFFFCCSAIVPSLDAFYHPRSRSTAEVFAEGQGLVLVGGAQADPVDALRARPQALEPNLERGLAVIDQERHLPGPHLHHHLRAQHAPVAKAEAGVEEASVVGADL